MKKKYLLLMLVGCLILASCAKNEKQNNEKKEEQKTEQKAETQNISLFAAASLEESLAKIIPEFEKENNVKVDVNLASSGKLQKQIEQKAPCDVFVSAGQKQVKALEEKQLVKDSKSLLKNKLVIVKNKETDVKVTKIEDLENVKGEIAVAELETVPVGQYTKQSLTHYNLLDKLQEKFVYGKNVKDTLRFVDSKEADVGFVYSSDAATDDKVEVALNVDGSSHKPIIYPITKTTYSKNTEMQNKLYEFLQNELSEKYFKEAGFESSHE